MPYFDKSQEYIPYFDISQEYMVRRLIISAYNNHWGKIKASYFQRIIKYRKYSEKNVSYF